MIPTTSDYLAKDLWNPHNGESHRTGGEWRLGTPKRVKVRYARLKNTSITRTPSASLETGPRSDRNPPPGRGENESRPFSTPPRHHLHYRSPKFPNRSGNPSKTKELTKRPTQANQEKSRLRTLTRPETEGSELKMKKTAIVMGLVALTLILKVALLQAKQHFLGAGVGSDVGARRRTTSQIPAGRPKPRTKVIIGGARSAASSVRSTAISRTTSLKKQPRKLTTKGNKMERKHGRLRAETPENQS